MTTTKSPCPRPGLNARPTHRRDSRGRGRGVAARIARAAIDEGSLTVADALADAAAGRLDLDDIADVHRCNADKLQGDWVAWDWPTMDWVFFTEKALGRALRRLVGDLGKMGPRPAPAGPVFIGEQPTLQPEPRHLNPQPPAPIPLGDSHHTEDNDQAEGSAPSPTSPAAQPPPPKIEDRLRALQLPLAQVHIKEPGSVSPEHVDALGAALERLEIPAAFWLETEKGDHLHGLVDRDSVATVVELYRDLAGDHPRGDHWIFHATEKGAAPCAVVLTLDFVQTPTAPIEKFTGYLSKQGLTLVIDTLPRDPSRNSPPPRGMDQ